MRRIARIQQPSAVLTKCLHAQPPHSLRCRAAVVATSSFSSRPRAFSTTPAHSGQSWPEDKAGKSVESPAETHIRSQPPRQPAARSHVPTQASEAPQTIETDLVLPPVESTIAPRPEDLDASEYSVAENAAGLPVVGGLKGWFAEDQDNDHWGPSKSFAGFAPEARITDPAQLELCVRRAIVEALAVQSAGVAGLLVESWRADGGWERVLGLGVKVDAEGQATLEGDVRGVVEGLVGDVGAREEILPVEQAREMVRVTNTDWKLISLKDAKLKFAVMKRVFQLTGHAIPDAKLLNVRTMGALLATVVKPEPARKVYEAVQQRGELTKLPNVSMYPKRRTPVDVAKDLGRWKIVEQELQKRGLPVLGSDSVDKFREAEWYHGPQPDKKDKKKGRRRR
ncbi:hypothetical protein N0V93_002751 [Gnomoniopsis smithogilvyi]|uniref:Large ribosomal subunit protein mL50 n=1 Tax=Gnomoniopsis smithogilvyi TaxID=1191159 RepID=A0A9W9CZG5_9PEZI|nr:hypothetical protein N0V93_002751 [Gnomoniopsis smithogilvyi]